MFDIDVNVFGWILVGTMFVILFVILAVNEIVHKKKKEHHDHR